MKRELIYERRQTADRMEAVMLVASAVALIGAIFAFLSYDWFPGLCLMVMASIAFAVSRLFDLIGDLFASASKHDNGPEPLGTEKGEKEI